MFRIRELRKVKNITMKQLGKIIGVAESTISLYENGKRQPDNDILIKLADYFEVSVDYLLGRDDMPQSPTLDEQLTGIDFALWSETQDMTDAEKQDIIDYIQFRKTKRTD